MNIEFSELCVPDSEEIEPKKRTSHIMHWTKWIYVREFVDFSGGWNSVRIPTILSLQNAHYKPAIIYLFSTRKIFFQVSESVFDSSNFVKFDMDFHVASIFSN